ncbi:hypothetical protein [Prosthecomicrobium pneumaticum]|uniref:Uncharacterized protein n=1 Tax=Prosthecomicrobium pneumaticum TaxID=81895 RepID=A0A7W9CTN8_9HYPH|nr:hypothetical protein [Prosthecomicrobium pneumaticum]MBB5751444.1 hypothetical protein [Prosthecomicrobium pneumaticum]
MKIVDLTIDPALLAKLDACSRNQLIGCMHAHNELSVVNRLLLFSKNETGKGAHYNHADDVQMWLLLQILAGKLFETWLIVKDRIVSRKPPEAIVAGLSAEHSDSLAWLRSYFGEKNHRRSPIKLVRDTTAFHYGGLDLQQAIGNLGDGENHVYLADHPANSLYFVGSAVVFRSLFAMIAREAGAKAEATYEELVTDGSQRVFDDVRNANKHIHLVLYGLIKALLEQVLGRDLEGGERTDIEVLDAPSPSKVRLPVFVTMGQGAKATDED